jgi:hypothetical protein
MTSRQRILAAMNGKADRAPLTTWSFGFAAPDHLRWQHDGREVRHWYSMRLEHIHTLPQRWTVEDDFRRARAWLSLGVDDVIDVSVPWSADPGVTWKDTRAAAGEMDACPVLVREYDTPSGALRHAIRQTGEKTPPGWVVQPESVWLFEDYNIPRGLKHAVATAADVPAIKHLYAPPDDKARRWFAARMDKVKGLADEVGVAVQAWSAFGMDAAVWLAGAEGAIMLALDQPQAFGELVETIAATDLARTGMAAANPGVDMVVQRGWYSSTDFWSPDLFDRYVFPHLKDLTAAAHRHGKKFAYVMTTGVEILGSRLADAGVDVLYFVDPVQDRLPLDRAKETLGDRMTLVGGANALTLQNEDRSRIRDEVRRAMDVLAPTGRFILHPVDAIFPDTPWEGVQAMIEAWKEYQQ